ncbi:MAG: hypothetical protein ACYDBB_05305 [Armatimonadota bacterium]
MPGDEYNDVPGDIVGEDAENLPGGFGTYDPDADVDATIDELIDNDVRSATGQSFYSTDANGMTSGTAYVEAVGDGSTIDPAVLLEGEEGHPGAAVGFTGAENDKRVAPETMPQHRTKRETENTVGGGVDNEAYTPEQRRDRSVESEGPFGAEGAGGSLRVDGGEKAA